MGMKADRVEVSRDEQKKQWLVRIQVGGEVIRRHIRDSKNPGENELRDLAVKVAADEGYTTDPSEVVLV